MSLESAYKVAIFISDLQYCFSFRDQRAVRNNLKVILQTQEVAPELVREVFRNFGRYLVEFFRVEKTINQEFIKTKVKIENWENIDKALAQGKGGIVISAHLGNWELGGILLGMLGNPVMAVALPHKERPVNDLFNHQREVKGMTVVSTNHAVRKCFEQLKNNQMVALVADRDFSLSGEIIDFLGRKAFLPKGIAILSIKTGAPIVPVFLIREENNHFRLAIHQPIFPDTVQNDAIEDAVIIKFIKKYIVIIEEQIRKYPTQWLMFREFWIK